MEPKIREILKKHNLTITLSGYKEMPSTDGYHMRGTLVINGKKAIFCEDCGHGGGLDMEVLNKEYADLLFNLKEEVHAITYDYAGAEINASLDSIFYGLAENNILQKRAKKCLLAKFNNEKYQEGQYVEFNFHKPIEMSQELINCIVREMEKRKSEKIEIFNIKGDWGYVYSIETLKNGEWKNA